MWGRYWGDEAPVVPVFGSGVAVFEDSVRGSGENSSAETREGRDIPREPCDRVYLMFVLSSLLCINERVRCVLGLH